MKQSAILSTLITLVACGGSGADPADDDSSSDGGLPPATTQQYVVNRIVVPTSSSEAASAGLDLDGDGAVDNKLGASLAQVASSTDVQANLDQAVASGRSIALAQLDAADLAGGTASFTMFRGSDPQPAPCASAADTTCGHHLDGSGAFTAQNAQRLDGAIASGVFDGGPATLAFDIALADPPITLSLLGARARLTSFTAASADGIVAGAISQTDIDTKILPAIQAQLESVLAAQCTARDNPTGNPPCGCPATGKARQIIQLLDTAPRDCTVTVTEIQNNALVGSLFEPDVTIDSMPALSVGFRITAVTASF